MPGSSVKTYLLSLSFHRSRHAANIPTGASAREAGCWRLRWLGIRAVLACVAISVIGAFDARSENPIRLASMVAPGLSPMALWRRHGGETALIQRVQAVPGFLVASASGPAGEPLPLVITLPPQMPGAYTFLMFRGMPERVTLSAGFRSKDQWVLSLRDVDKLNLLPPPDYEGLFALEVLLMSGQDARPERRIVTIEFERRNRLVPPATTSILPPAAQPSQLRATTAVEKVAPPQGLSEPDRAMLTRADRLVRDGDVAAARLIYGHMARQGIAEGALGMARSYDPEVLSGIPLAGLQPDLAKARDWYQKAQDLGSVLAKGRLGALGAERR